MTGEIAFGLALLFAAGIWIGCMIAKRYWIKTEERLRQHEKEWIEQLRNLDEKMKDGKKG